MSVFIILNLHTARASLARFILGPSTIFHTPSLQGEKLTVKPLHKLMKSALETAAARFVLMVHPSPSSSPPLF